MSFQTLSLSTIIKMNKKYLFVTVFLISLVTIGAYFVYKVPSNSTNQLSQESLPSDNIDTEDTNTLGVETDLNSTTDTIVSGKTNMQTDNLVVEDKVVGTGEEAVSGKKVTVNYSGTLTDGTKFDSSYDRNEPFSFNLGAGEVIAGWDQGVAGMKVGGKRKLIIPPSLGYGSQQVGPIPANSTLVFDVELLKVE
jgi:peptidylprolyl isomerase